MFKKIINLLVVILAVIYGSSVFSATQAVTSLTPVQQLSQLLKSYHTYQARFKQTTYGDKGQVLQSSLGKVILAKPDQFYWQVNSPSRQIVISNGRYLWNYNVALAQVTKQRVVENQKQLTPAMLLTGNLKQLQQHFRVQHLPQQGTLLFQLKPKNSKSAMFSLVVMQFVRERLRWMKVVNSLGQTSVFYFSGIKVNAKVDAKIFQFKPPHGVDVVEITR